MDKKLAKKVLFDTADILERIGLQFFLSDGTCLGAHREGDFIEYDTDMDLKVKAEDFVPKFPQIRQMVIQAGYRIYKNGSPFSFPNRMKIRTSSLHLDICILYLIDGARRLWGSSYCLFWPTSLFDNPKQIDFLGRKFNIPTPVTEYLELTYGPDYMTPNQEFSHPESSKCLIDTNRIPGSLRNGRK